MRHPLPMRMLRAAMCASVVLLAACSLPARAPAPLLYDFGLPAPLATAPGETNAMRLALEVQASPALETSAMLYRLSYADANQLHAYAQSRWAMPPADLVQQRLRDRLAARFVLQPASGGARVLRVDMEEFSQVYASTTQSAGVLHLRAAVLQRTATGEQVLAVKNLLLQRPASAADAAGGVRALAAAVDAAAEELGNWLQTLR